MPLRVLLVALTVASTTAALAQEHPPFNERQSIGQTWIQFAQCLSRSDAGCLLSFISNDGVSAAPGEPSVSKQEFKNELRVSNSTQCFFWADRCGRKSTNPCAMSHYTESGSPAPRYFKPEVRDGHWQVQVIVPHFSNICDQDIPILFRLEDGMWRIVTIPYS